jgi:phage terminase large subunit-like protein
MGADLSQGDDFCAFTFLFPLGNGAYGIKTRSYITEQTLHKLPSAARFKYEEFRKEGSLIILNSTVLDMNDVFDDLMHHIDEEMHYDVRCFGYDPYNAKEFVARWETENAAHAVEKVIQGPRTESVPLGELKKLAEQELLIFDEFLMQYAMGNAITLQDTNGNRKLYKRRHEEKIDNVAALMDAWVAFKLHKEEFE